jgi:glycosyltransferase involved in cell wall biosynthesis
MDGVVWVAWERHRRATSLARLLDVPFCPLQSRQPRLLKHPLLAWRTIRLLLRERPSVLIVQNPSIVLALLALTLRPLFRYRLVVDAHNAAVQVGVGPLRHLAPLYRAVQRHADRIIVTNAPLADIVNDNGGRAIVLPDAVPDFPGVRAGSHSSQRTVTFICSFAEDEPWLEAMSAVERLPEDVTMYVTGRIPTGLARTAVPKSPHLKLTGFLQDPDYISLLAGSDVIVDLTRREDCLVCGAYEAVALGVPLVLSDTAALRSYFRRGVVYAPNTASGIAASIREALERREALRGEVVALRSELAQDWSRQFQSLITYLGCA